MIPTGFGTSDPPSGESYQLGRGTTLIVVIIVAAITLSAMLGGFGSRRKGKIELYVTLAAGESLERYVPFQRLLARKTGKPVELRGGPPAEAAGELFIFDAVSYFLFEKERELRPVAVLLARGREPDKALLVTTAESGVESVSGVSRGDVVFASATSVNGFLVPLEMLVEGGFPPPRTLADVRFAGFGGAGGRGALIELLSGEYLVAACSGAELRWLEEEGLLPEGRIRILRESDGLPERLVACSVQDSAYYAGKLEAIAECFRQEECRGNENIVELSRERGIAGLRAPGPRELARLERMVGRYGSLFREP